MDGKVSINLTNQLGSTYNRLGINLYNLYNDEAGSFHGSNQWPLKFFKWIAHAICKFQRPITNATFHCLHQHTYLLWQSHFGNVNPFEKTKRDFNWINLIFVPNWLCLNCYTNTILLKTCDQTKMCKDWNKIITWMLSIQKTPKKIAVIVMCFGSH